MPLDANIRKRLLFKLEQDQNFTVKTLTAECQWLLNLKTRFYDGSTIGKSIYHQQCKNKKKTHQQRSPTKLLLVA